MYSLFQVKFPWLYFIVFLIIFRVLTFEMSWYSFIAIAIFLHQLILLFNSIGTVIPIRYLFGVLMCVQMFVGPVLAYSGLQEYYPLVYRMQVPETEYFTYMIPAISLFILGLHVSAKKLQGEVLDIPQIKSFVESSGELPFYLIVAGFLATFIRQFFGSELGFVFYLMANAKFVGLFMLIIGGKKINPIWIILVLGSTAYTAIQQAMFHDVVIWIIFTGAVIAIQYKPSLNLKILVAVIFVVALVVLQLIKGDYREATWRSGEESGVGTMTEVIANRDKSTGFFDKESLAGSTIRINQGFIVSHIIKNVPEQIPFSNGGALWQVLEASILPRVLAPNKLTAGNRDFFNKWTGMHLQEGTSMALSSPGDGYVNFGIIGGAIFMFFLGLVYSFGLNKFSDLSKNFPAILLFVPLIYYYPIRPDCELQTSLGHFIKSSFLVVLLYHFIKFQAKRSKILIKEAK